jgi:hypothetical protein
VLVTSLSPSPIFFSESVAFYVFALSRSLSFFLLLAFPSLVSLACSSLAWTSSLPAKLASPSHRPSPPCTILHTIQRITALIADEGVVRRGNRRWDLPFFPFYSLQFACKSAFSFFQILFPMPACWFWRGVSSHSFSFPTPNLGFWRLR